MASITDLEAKKNNKPTVKSTTGVRGVYYNKRRDNYTAVINVDKKQVYLGASKSFEKAVAKQAEIKYGYKQDFKKENK